jgi:hypothetical protein
MSLLRDYFYILAPVDYNKLFPSADSKAVCQITDKSLMQDTFKYIFRIILYTERLSSCTVQLTEIDQTSVYSLLYLLSHCCPRHFPHLTGAKADTQWDD